MTSYTTPYILPYLDAADPLAGIDEYTLALCNRIQTILNGKVQMGKTTITPSAAATDTFKTITLPYTIFGTPYAVAVLGESPGTSGAVIFVKSGSETITSFDIGIRTVTGTAARTVYWMAGGVS